jgi:hypothetical protein
MAFAQEKVRLDDVPDTVWRNTRYQVGCGGGSGTPFEVDVREGTGTYNTGSPVLTKISVVKVASGDVAGDSPATAVLLDCFPGGNYTVHEIQVFGPNKRYLATLQPPDLHPEGTGPGPDFEEDRFAIENGQLHTAGLYYGAGGCHAGGPTIRHELIWQWDGTHFAVTPGPALPGPGHLCTTPTAPISTAPVATTTSIIVQGNLTPEAAAGGLFRAWQNQDRAAALRYGTASAVNSFFNYDPLQPSNNPGTAEPTCGASGIPNSVNCDFGFISMRLPNAPPGSWQVVMVSVNND